MPKIVQYFSDMVNSQSDMEVVGTAQSGAEVVSVVDETKPDIVLMDMQMEYQNAGVDATRTICEKNPGTKVIMITVHGEDDYMFEAYAAGVVDFFG
ncbi:MAG: response regulator transcription factor [Clostridiales bacterium]|nr:MAG: response regulator transcription factor [Clostridiales bacterium]